MTDHQHTADALNRAADLIEERGWVQGNGGWYGGSSPLCLEGALAAALGIGRSEMVGEGGFYVCPAHNAVADYLERDPAPRYAPIRDALWGWNDARGRTAAEVIEVLRATAVIEQARADEHTATDTGYDTTAEMLAVAGDAAARTLAAIR